MTILYTNDIGTFFDQTLLGHIKRGENNEALSNLKNADPCQLASSLGTTLLHFAAKYDNLKFAQHLIDLGMPVDVQNRFAETPLMFAVDANKKNIVQMLLKAKADPLVPDIGGRCALGKALVNKHNVSENIFKALLNSITIDLLKKNIDYVKSEQFHLDCEIYHFIPLKEVEITRILLESGSRANAKNSKTQNTALHVAAACLDLEHVKLLLKYGANVNAQGFKKRTPLACIPIAAQEDHGKAIAIVKVLLVAGATLIDHDSKQITAWSILSWGNREMVRVVLQGQIDLQFRSWAGDTALHFLSRNRQPDVLKEVQDLASALKIRSSLGFNMLHTAASAGSANNIEYLLDHGADVNGEDKAGQTPLHLMMNTRLPFKKYHDIFYDYLSCIEVLLERGAHPRLASARRFEDYPTEKDELVKLSEPVLAHLALLEASGEEIEESMRREIESRVPYKTVFALQERQLDDIKQIKIGQKVTLLDFLIASDQQISLYARNQRLTTNLGKTLEMYSSKDSYYYRKLQKSFAKFTELSEKRKKVATAVTKIFNELHDISVDVVVENIVNFLQDHELYKI